MVKARTNISMSSNKSKKSKELRKYEIAYHKCIKMGMKSRDCKKSIKNLRPKTRKRLRKSLKRSRKRTHTFSPKRIKRSRIQRSSIKRSRSKRSRSKRSRSKRALNSYQKFVRKESSKSVYKGQSARSRMRAISKLWKRSRN